MQIKFVSVFVYDQASALKFYTEVLGFQKIADISLGDHRWLAVVSPDGIEWVELVLEPLAFEPARIYQKALFDAGIPATAFITKDIQAEHHALIQRGVVFQGEPQKMVLFLRSPLKIPAGT